MVRIGNYRDQFASAPTPKINPGPIVVLTSGDGAVYASPVVVTDIVGSGYPDSTPIQVPPGSSSGAFVNTTPKMYEGIEPRHNTPANPPEVSTGTVQMPVTNISGSVTGILQQNVQYTPPNIQNPNQILI